MMTCKCGCEETMHSDAFGCMTCGCMTYEMHKRSNDCEVNTARGRVQEILIYARPDEMED
jgi:predicted  nucleic acid-binding Zn-ribbon protein